MLLLLLSNQVFNRFGADTQMRLDELRQFLGRDHDRINRHSGRRTDRVDGVQIKWIADGQRDLIVVGTEWEDAKTMN